MNAQKNITGVNFCPYCGQEFASETSFCPYCGKDLITRQPVENSQKLILNNIESDGNTDQFNVLKDKVSDVNEVLLHNYSFGTFKTGITSERYKLIKRFHDLITNLIERAPHNEDYRHVYRCSKNLFSYPGLKNDEEFLPLEAQMDLCVCISFLISCHLTFTENKCISEELMKNADIIARDIILMQKLCVNKNELFADKRYGEIARHVLTYDPYNGEGSTKETPDKIEKKKDLIKKNNSKKSSTDCSSDIYKEIKSLENELKDILPNFKRHIYDQNVKYWDELENLIGLSMVKEQLRRQIDNYKLQMKRKQLHPELVISSSFHCIFKGKPGTGKTTVARLVAGILKEEGLLDNGCCVEVTASELISGYIGVTPKYTKLAVLKAIDGVLFVDEAYSLMNAKGHKSDHGAEAIDTLTPLMENYRNRIVVILAGYDEEMDEFLAQANTGFPSRFKAVIQFEDYNSAEMLKIFYKLTKNNGYRIDEDALRRAAAIFKYIEGKKDSIPTFANARSVRSIYETVVERASRRMLKSIDSGVDLDLLTLEDVSLSRHELQIALGIL